MRPVLADIKLRSKTLFKSSDLEEIKTGIASLNKEAEGVQEEADSFYNAFEIIGILCYFNLMFFITDIVKFIFLRKIGR